MYDDRFSIEIWEFGGPETALCMSILSAGLGIYGYYSEVGAQIARRIFGSGSRLHLTSLQAAFACCLLLVPAVYGIIGLANLSGGLVSQFAGGQHYQLVWEGEPVIYAFFIGFLVLAVPFAALIASRGYFLAGMLTMGLVIIYPLMNVLYLGRRGVLAGIGLSVLCCALFLFNRRLTKATSLSALVAGALFLQLAPMIREETQWGVRGANLSLDGMIEELEIGLKGESFLEFDGLVLYAAAVNKTGMIGFGTNFYNSLVSQLVPKAIVGSAKDTWYFSLWDGADSLYSILGRDLPYGANPTGPATLIQDFWLLGAVLYGLVGLLFRIIWEGAYVHGDDFAACLYSGVVPLAAYSVIGSFFVFAGSFFVALVVNWLLFRILSLSKPIS